MIDLKDPKVQTRIETCGSMRTHRRTRDGQILYEQVILHQRDCDCGYCDGSGAIPNGVIWMMWVSPVRQRPVPIPERRYVCT